MPTARRPRSAWLARAQVERGRARLPRQRDDRVRGQPGRDRVRDGEPVLLVPDARRDRRQPGELADHPPGPATTRATSSTSPARPCSSRASTRRRRRSSWPSWSASRARRSSRTRAPAPTSRSATSTRWPSGVTTLAPETPVQPAPALPDHDRAARDRQHGDRADAPGRAAVTSPGPAGGRAAAARPAPAPARGGPAAAGAAARRADRGSALGVAVLLALPLVFLLIETSGHGLHQVVSADRAAADRRAAVEHGPAHRGGDGRLRGHRHRRRLAGGAHRPARPPDLGGAARGAAGHPRLRGQLRLGLAVDLGARLPRRRPGHDAGRLPAGLPAGRGQPAVRRPGPGGGGPQPRHLPAADVLRGSRSARPAARSWAAACWSRWSCWPSTAPSSCSATRRSPPRSSPSSTSRSASRRPARCPWCWSGSACWCWAARGMARGRGRVARTGAGAPSGSARRCGWAGPPGRRWPPVAALVVAALGVPVYSSVYWVFEGGIPSVTAGSVSMLDALAHTAGYGAAAGVPGHPGRPAGRAAGHPAHRPRPALPGAQHLPGAGHARRGDRLRAGLLHRALPGRPRLPDRAAADRLLRDHVLPARAGRGEGGRRPRARPAWTRWPAPWARARPPRLRRVTLRLAGPGLAAAFCLVFLSVVTELTATLLLIPTGRADAGHPVLAVRDRRLLRAGGAVRASP